VPQRGLLAFRSAEKTGRRLCSGALRSAQGRWFSIPGQSPKKRRGSFVFRTRVLKHLYRVFVGRLTFGPPVNIGRFPYWLASVPAGGRTLAHQSASQLTRRDSTPSRPKILRMAYEREDGAPLSMFDQQAQQPGRLSFSMGRDGSGDWDRCSRHANAGRMIRFFRRQRRPGMVFPTPR